MTSEAITQFRAGDDVRLITSGMVGRINSSDETGTYHEIWLYGDGERMFGVPSWQIEHAASEAEPDGGIEACGGGEADNVIDIATARKAATLH